ncbi:SMI1/KNR4 family protein [Neorhodopirellula pilleata]|uniref:SMI1 / KNR4 family protein n=1 Tax=Neorhodopirellula pilleata TaxID=2714738 RepID=A0A5C5ZVJ7_9BACT|nr:SMI1/KNR4 family protein [Neorhodopirellula pilleata]TWT91339.1 SMI1 / KNR4 family protein [Neorhodopirellula pilleata]
MEFLRAERGVTESEIDEIEMELALSFPESLRELYKNHNGSEPEPYVYENPELQISTVVSRILPLISEKGAGTAITSYNILIRDRRLAPQHFFPFAVDSGGDYFLMNTQTGNVFFLRSDNFPEVEVVSLGLTLDSFWQALTDE